MVVAPNPRPKVGARLFDPLVAVDFGSQVEDVNLQRTARELRTPGIVRTGINVTRERVSRTCDAEQTRFSRLAGRHERPHAELPELLADVEYPRADGHFDTLHVGRRTEFELPNGQVEVGHSSPSGHGSYGGFAEFKAGVLNRFVAEQRIETVLEFGCGDGNQLSLASYRDYVGLDVSETALRTCRKRFAGDRTKRFLLYRPGTSSGGSPRHSADLALSLDVIYHLTEDAVFESYMNDLFDAARRFVVIYSSDTAVTDPSEPAQVRHRVFSRWVAERRPRWRLLRRIPNRFPIDNGEERGSFAEFFIYAPADDDGGGGA